MAKNVVVFIDGTSNSGTENSRTNTNVYKLYLAAKGAALDQQCCLYIPGVGSWGLLTRMPGAIAGLGLSLKIRQGYKFLVENYHEGDRIYLFGFSRGAFAARSLAGFVDHVGLLLSDHIGMVREAFRIYRSDQSIGKSKLKRLVKKINPAYAGEEKHPLPIYFIGVWDTVGRLGLPGVNALLPERYVMFHKTDLPPNVTHARQALALHELRRIFNPELWISYQPPQSLKQTWFLGAHADVGGGYDKQSLSDISLCWMSAEAKQEKLVIDESVLTVAPNYLAPIHQEIKGLFHFYRPECRPMLLKLKHPQPWETAFVHDSVIARYFSARQPDHPGRRRVRDKLWLIDAAAQRLSLWLANTVGNKPDACLSPCPANGRPVRVCCVANGDWWDELGGNGLEASASLVYSVLVKGDSVPEVNGVAGSLAQALCVLFILGQHRRLSEALESFRQARNRLLSGILALTTVHDVLEAIHGPTIGRPARIEEEVQKAGSLLPEKPRGVYMSFVEGFTSEDAPNVDRIRTAAKQHILRIKAEERPRLRPQ